MNNKTKGNIGENIACNFLINNGYAIIETNAKLLGIEIDIIAKDYDNTIVFIEVKSRNSFNYGHPFEAVTPYKQNRYRTFAKQYIMVNKKANNNFRFDVIGVFDNEVEHIINAF